MTAKDILVAVKPLQGFAEALGQIETIAREATRLAQGLEESRRKLADLDAQVRTRDAAYQESLRVMAVQRQAAETEARRIVAEAQQAADTMTKSAIAQVATARAEQDLWQGRVTKLRAEHDALVTTLKTEEQRLQGQVATLRAAAKRIADQAASVA